MRTIINISVPPELDRTIKAEMKKNHFATKSEFLRHVLREWLTTRLLEDIKAGEREYREGKTTVLKDVKDLWK